MEQSNVNLKVQKAPCQIRDVALSYAKSGLSVISTDPKTKMPFGYRRWIDYQIRIITESEISNREWPGLAIICGEVSGELECIDFDYLASWVEDWEELVEMEAPGLTRKLLKQKTQSGGEHRWYRCPEISIPGSMKLAHDKVEVSGPGEHEYIGKKHKSEKVGCKYFIFPCMIETRGQKAYALTAPTAGYELVSGSFENVPVITAADREVLFRAARVLNRKISEPKSQQATASNGLRPGDIYNAECTDIRPMLEKHGWNNSGKGFGKFEYWIRPGKERGWSASVIDGRLLCNFSSNASPLEPNTTYTAFALLVYLEYNGDFRAAAKALSKDSELQPDHELLFRKACDLRNKGLLVSESEELVRKEAEQRNIHVTDDQIKGVVGRAFVYKEGKAPSEHPLHTVSKKLGINIKRVIKLGKSNCRWLLELQDGTRIDIGSTSNLNSWKRTMEAIQERTRITIPKFKPDTWLCISANLALAAEEEHLPEQLEVFAQWLNDFVHNCSYFDVSLNNPDNWKQNFECGKTFFQEGNLYIFADDFVNHLNNFVGTNMTHQQVFEKLRLIGFENKGKSVRIRGQVKNKSAWFINYEAFIEKLGKYEGIGDDYYYTEEE
ncbi:bifunctional DNA primase/polymerase [Desulfonatronum parangueonense]